MNIHDMQIQAAERNVRRARGAYARDMARRRLIAAFTDAVVARDGPLCRYCKVETQPTGPDYQRRTVDHLIPVSKGGKDTKENLVIACKTCNCRRGNRPVQEFARL